MGYNMFAYCNDNPVMFVDYSGLLSENIISESTLFDDINEMIIDSIVTGEYKFTAFDRWLLLTSCSSADLWSVSHTIIGEAGGMYEYENEWQNGQDAVARLIINRSNHGGFQEGWCNIVTAYTISPSDGKRTNQFDGFYDVIDGVHSIDYSLPSWEYACILSFYIVSGQHNKIRIPDGFSSDFIYMYGVGKYYTPSEGECVIAGNKFYQ